MAQAALPTRLGRHRTLALAALLLAAAGDGRTDAASPALPEGAPSSTPYKLTAGHYQFAGGATGTDVNLRHSSALGNAWIGYFESSGQDIRQGRAGWDRTWGEPVRITPSLQLASQGFVGGSLQVETGERWFVGAGLGRTNLQPYWNLNFDPNDAYLLTAGHRADNGRTLALQLIQDNRDNPDQRHVHLYWRQALPDAQRVTVDLLYKEGLVDGVTIHRWGASLSYDWPRYFLRLAYDPNANFGTEDLWRFSLGTRF